MPSIYTDESRLRRYEKLQKKKKICELVFSISMFITLIYGVTLVVNTVFKGSIWGLFINDMSIFWTGLLSIAVTAYLIYALFRRDWRFLLPAAVLTVGFLAPALIASFVWGKLKEEEGFPDFKISQTEQHEREQAIVNRLEQRALQEGTRVKQEQLDPAADMNDLLGDGQQALPADLRGYHERSMNAEAAVQVRPQHDGTMDSLEEL